MLLTCNSNPLTEPGESLTYPSDLFSYSSNSLSRVRMLLTCNRMFAGQEIRLPK